MDTRYYQILFTNGKEFFIESTFDSVELFILNVYDLNNIDGFLALKSEAKNPLYVRKSEIFSIQSVDKESLGTQIRKWRLL